MGTSVCEWSGVLGPVLGHSHGWQCVLMGSDVGMLMVVIL